MLTLTFAEFAEGSKFPDFEDLSLYVVREGKKILYVGISQSNIYNRWFASPSSHMWITDDGRFGSNSSIGIHIASNLPKSYKWRFDFWTLKEALDFMKIDYLYNADWQVCLHPVSKRQLSIKDAEPKMINFLSPKFNVTYNGARLTQRAADEGDSPAKIYFSALKHLSTKKADSTPALHR